MVDHHTRAPVFNAWITPPEGRSIEGMAIARIGHSDGRSTIAFTITDTDGAQMVCSLDEDKTDAFLGELGAVLEECNTAALHPVGAHG